MKVLAFTDVHTDESYLKELESKVKDVDLVLNTGDFSWLGQRTEEMLERFNSWNKPMLMVHGNHEWIEEVTSGVKNCKNIKLIHNKIEIINDIMFIGHGGEWYHQTSPEFEAWIPILQKEIQTKKPKKVVLMVHMPVYGTKQDFLFGSNRGNISYRNFIELVNPDIVLFGHFHESFHIKDKIGKSLLINPGPDGELLNL